MDMAKGQGAPATAEAHGAPLGRTHSATEPRRQTSQARPGSGHRVAAAADRLSGCGLSCRRCCRCCLVRPQPGETYVRVSPESGCPSDLAKHLGYLFPTCFYFLLFGPFYYLRQGLMSAKLASNILCCAAALGLHCATILSKAPVFCTALLPAAAPLSLRPTPLWEPVLPTSLLTLPTFDAFFPSGGAQTPHPGICMG